MSNNKKVSLYRSANAKITSTVSITLVLVLLGITILTIFMGKGLSDFVKENMSFNVMLADNLTDAQINVICRDIDAKSFVKSSRFISREEAKEQLIKDLGEDPEELLGFNPARDCIEIFLRSEYANRDSIAIVNQVIRQNNNVTDLLYQQEAIDLINNNLSRVMTILLVLATMLLFISFTLIRNTIRLSVYSKRFIINTMKLVGATSGFIRRPFIVSNIITGIVAGLIANAVIFSLIIYFSLHYIEISSIITTMDKVIIFSIVVLLGVLISSIAAAFAVNRYLKMDTDKLYYI
ncbi:MAG: permease-like cell division protein FtsX [Dysgonamonadaceae bacterium]|jgi:cell division transport system permease protein|nr:permease-like cell division protein FtsX [Dysgonamonadaceae bacterium]